MPRGKTTVGYETILTLDGDGTFEKMQRSRQYGTRYFGTYSEADAGEIDFHVTQKIEFMSNWNSEPESLDNIYRCRLGMDGPDRLVVNQILYDTNDETLDIRWDESFWRINAR